MGITLLELGARFLMSIYMTLRHLRNRTDSSTETKLLPAFDADDVAYCYILFLGRYAESEDVLKERAGQPLIAILDAFIGSDEFATWTKSIVRSSATVTDVLRAPPSADMLAWMTRVFGPEPFAARRLASSGTILAALCVILSIEPVRSVLARHIGRYGASLLRLRLRAIAKRLKTSLPLGPTASSEDVHHLYLLIHGRSPESAIAGGARPDLTPLALAADMLQSREFALKILPSALDGHLGDDAPLVAETRHWIETVFGIVLADEANRQTAVRAILMHPAIYPQLVAAKLLWSVDHVIERLDRRTPVIEEVAAANAAPSLLTLLTSSGLFDEAWYRTRYRDIRHQTLEPLLHLVNFGISERRDPGPGFDTAFYIQRYPDVETSGLAPLEHYLRIGQALGYVGVGEPQYIRWLDRFHDLTPSDRASIQAHGEGSREDVLCLHLGGDLEHHDTGSQIGVRAEHRLVGRNVDATMLDGVRDGTLVIIVGGEAMLRPHACFAFAESLRIGPGRLAYADHDHVGADGRPTQPVFKPAMSPDFMRRLPYAGPVVAIRLHGSIRNALVRAVSEASEGDADVALAHLLLAVDPREVVRVALPLFSLPIAADARLIMGREVLEPESSALRVEEGLPLERAPQVCILIPTRDHVDVLRECIDSIIAETDYPAERMRITVIDNGSIEAATLDYFRELVVDPRLSVVASPGPFNFAKICNDGAASTDAEILVFLNNDMTVRERDWLTTLVANAVRPEIGAVGAQLLYPDDTVQHGGVILGLQALGGHRLIGVPAAEAAMRDATREMTAVTGACLALRRTVFEEVGGFDEVLAVAFNDVVLCMALASKGYRNLYVARALLYHHESKSRGLDDTPAKRARNISEAIHARQMFPALFREDPSYSPNLSLQDAGALAFPPRTLLPWRRHPLRRRVLLVSVGHGIGHGVGTVVALQAERFRQRGWEVLVGGPVSANDRVYPGCRRIAFTSPESAASVAVAEAVDCVIVHTPPFFSIVRYLGNEPIIYAYDHGEPPPGLFPDRQARENVNLEKRLCMPLAHRVLAISDAIRDEGFDERTIVLRNGNSHLASWSADWAARRSALRERFGFGDRYVILNVCRFGAAERAYKGVDDYIRLAAELPYAVTATAGRCLFVLVGRGDDKDVAFVQAAGLTVFANVSDAEMAELYAASDLYVGLSRWEGYDLGIGQALAMGLEAIASDIPAHREFGIATAHALPELCRLVGAAFDRRHEAALDRRPRIESWDRPLDRLVELAETDLPANSGNGTTAVQARIKRQDTCLADLSGEALRALITELNDSADQVSCAIFRPPGEHDCVAIIFAGNAESFFMLAAARRLRCPVIYVQDPLSYWYQGSALLPDLDSFVRDVLLSEVGLARALLFGQSSGGYAALAASVHFSAATVVACAPQTFSDAAAKARLRFVGVRALSAPEGLIDLKRRLSARSDPNAVRAAVIAAGEVGNPAHTHWWGDYLHMLRMVDVSDLDLYVVNNNNHALAHGRVTHFANLLAALSLESQADTAHRQNILSDFLTQEFMPIDPTL